ncbi:hypothetical protein RYX36_010544 [Vicia faba]
MPLFWFKDEDIDGVLAERGGSYALLGSVVPRDAGVVTKLRKAGAIILGKATLSEWSHYRSAAAPSGWSARGGQGKNPYTLGFPCGSSSGSAISVAANLVTVSLGTKTDGSILCPSNFNSVVGIKPTVGLTSRAGGYAQFLKKDGLRGKRLGVVRLFYNFGNDTFMHETFKLRLKTLRQRGAVLVDNLKIDDIDDIIVAQSEIIALNFEFKLSLNAYLKDLIASPVKSLAVSSYGYWTNLGELQHCNHSSCYAGVVAGYARGWRVRYVGGIADRKEAVCVARMDRGGSPTIRRVFRSTSSSSSVSIALVFLQKKLSCIDIFGLIFRWRFDGCQR